MRFLPCTFLFLLLLVGAVTLLRGQEILVPRAYETQNVGIVYDYETSFPVIIQQRGLQIGINRGRIKTYYKTTYFGLTAGILRHPREYAQSRTRSSILRGGAVYKYGKQRTLLPVRVYKGWKRYYAGKQRRRGVAVASVLEFGAVAGLAKDYILQVAGSSDANFASAFISYGDNPELFLNENRIEGAGGFGRGWDGLTLYPGITGKAAVQLDWGAFDEYMRAMEAGITVDFFLRKVELLTPPAPNTPLFVNFYLALQLGKRR